MIHMKIPTSQCMSRRIGIWLVYWSAIIGTVDSISGSSNFFMATMYTREGHSGSYDNDTR